MIHPLVKVYITNGKSGKNWALRDHCCGEFDQMSSTRKGALMKADMEAKSDGTRVVPMSHVSLDFEASSLFCILSRLVPWSFHPFT